MPEYALVTLETAAKRYERLTVRTLRAWIRCGKLSFVKSGRSYLVDPADIAEMMKPKRLPAMRA